MYNKTLSFVSALFVFFLVPVLNAEPPAGGEWKLVWGDEFDGAEVDNTKWEKVGDGPRRKALWLKECCYQDGKGSLVVDSKKKGKQYACGGVRSKGRFMHSYGYYEIRCKVPDEVGTWAAFWLYAPCVGKVGNGGTDGAEIDIFEAVWRDKDAVNVAVHWDGYGKAHRSYGKVVKTPGVNEGFHTFGLQWTPEEYIFYYDGREVKRTSAGGVCRVPLYVKVTTEIGSWAGDIRKAKLPDTFVVDYVRVYENKDPLALAHEKLSWRLACQLYTFRQYSFYEALDKIDKLGIKYLEPCFFLPLAKEHTGATTSAALSPKLRKELKEKLAEHDMKMACYYAPLDADPAKYRPAFEFAKEMGVSTIVAEPPETMMDLAEKLCDEYEINLAIHNHPKSPNYKYWDPDNVLKVIKGRSKRIGACVDTGHWIRSGLKPVECLKKLEGRIMSVHLKDVKEWGKPSARDVPLGEGKAQYAAVLKELKRQGFKGVLSIEYEHQSPELMKDIAACVAFFKKTASSLIKDMAK